MVGFFVSRGATDSYVASTRLLFPSAQPTGDVSESLADTAAGIATSRSQIRTVLEDIGAQRDASDVADDQVVVEPLGESGVVDVTVTDSDPEVAVGLANGLAERVARVQFEAISEGTRKLLGEVRDRTEALSGRISAAQGQVASTGVPTPKLAGLLERQANLRAERRELVSQLATLPEPKILDPTDRSEVDAASSGRVQDIALGGLVGLVLGITLAAVLETLRPAVAGREGLRAAFDAPILGTFTPRSDAAGRKGDLVSVSRLLAAAAAAAGIAHVRLVRAGKPLVDLHMLAAELQAILTTPNGDGARRPARSPVNAGSTPSPGAARDPRRALWEDSEATPARARVAELTIDVVDRRSSLPLDSFNGEGGTGLVVVTPRDLERTEVDRVQDLAAITGWPVLGLISTKV